MGEFLELKDPAVFWENYSVYLENIKRGKEVIDFSKAKNRIVAKEIKADEDLPPFSRSTVDGFAVRAKDTAGASSSLPQYFEVIGEIEMGDKSEFKIASGEAVQIPTGGMLPSGADAVVMVEYSQPVDDSTVEISRPVAVGENVVLKGEDIACGETLLAKGHRIRPRDIGALVGLGITELEVFSQPEVAVISTGDELVNPNEKIKQGEIRDINSYSISSIIEELGAKPRIIGIVEDSLAKLKMAIKENLDADLILISGGSSVGVKDLTIKLLNDLGEPGVLLHGLSIKPGKPTIQAVVDHTPVMGIPGHPASAWTITRIMVIPLIRVLQGEMDWEEAEKMECKYQVQAELNRNISSDRGREEYIPVRLYEDSDGSLKAEPITGKSSLITTLVEGEGLLKIKRYVEGKKKGETVKIKLIDQL
ncbi:MAG: gephyrin-like molybdotransferase Glp [Halanaerobiales bacterium]